MASHSIAACGLSPQVHNHTHANQTIDMSGAVNPPVKGLPVRIAETEIPARLMQPRNQRSRIPARSISVAEVIRLARLCVLILNPILPGARSTGTSPDLASSRTLYVGPSDRPSRVNLESAGSYLAPQASLTMR